MGNRYYDYEEDAPTRGEAMPAKKTAATESSGPKPVFVVQVQEKKNGPWRDDEGDYVYLSRHMNDHCEFSNKTHATTALKKVREDVLGEAKDEYENPPRRRGEGYESFFVEKGTDLDELIKKVTAAHKKFNPKSTKPKQKAPFDPESVYPKFRVVQRTYVDEVVG